MTARSRSTRPHHRALFLSTAISFLLLAAGCGDPRQPVSIHFKPELQGVAISCDTAPGMLSDLRFYISNPALITDDNERVPIKLVIDSRWQSETIALLDLENGAGRLSRGYKRN